MTLMAFEMVLRLECRLAGTDPGFRVGMLEFHVTFEVILGVAGIFAFEAFFQFEVGAAQSVFTE